MKDLVVLKANEDLLNKIHKRVADRILERLDDPESDINDLNTAIKFLKDNNIKADPEFNPTVKQVQHKVDVQKLPFTKSE